MSANQTVILNAAGLVTSPNELSREEGALIEASNVVIRRDGIIEQRRGVSLYGSALPESTDRAKQLATYRNTILRHYSNKLQFDSNARGAFLDFAGTVSETSPGLRIKFIESTVTCISPHLTVLRKYLLGQQMILALLMELLPPLAQ